MPSVNYCPADPFLTIFPGGSSEPAELNLAKLNLVNHCTVPNSRFTEE